MGKLRFQSSAQLPFRIDLQRAAQAYLAERGDHRHADWRVGLKGAALAALSLACYALALRATTAWSFAPAYIAAIVMAMLLAMNTLHDAAHGALFRNARLNQWLTRAASLPMGIDADIWTRRHVHLHHTYPNIDGYDLDIEPNPFLRQTPFQDWAPQFRFQHRYWPLVAALSLPYLCWYGDWLDLLGKSKLRKYDNQPVPVGGFLLSKLGHLVLLLALPWYFLPAGAIGWGGLLLCYLAGLMAASCFLVAMILGTHWAEVEFFRPEGAEMPHTWHEHQFLTCCDWQPRPRALGHLLGGLHLHLTHHLFPAYSHRHYPALARIVEEQARRHGLPYRRIGYQGLWRAQQNFLRGMGRRPE
ncbi:acyl-CoA desaturase [Chromobacterium vaccinii]|uniref:Acyl-CoA desaturase n=1 Tax=Chromobacterium vaccinii TaxID=1108595 RepID=A0A1D9LCQ8_9NEIS|nr:acyl-CoA desaturase [Chromobacterium vaccinii]AOZ49025.1 acyl-CoA desaturase [Chromobacterium vaccinii]